MANNKIATPPGGDFCIIVGITVPDGPKSLPLTMEVYFAKQKTEGEISLPQSA